MGEPKDRKIRAELLDEGLEILVGLWSARPFSYSGKHNKMGEMTFRPRPIQRPRIPIWVVGAWPRMKSINRALKYDGLIPTKINPGGGFATITPDDIREMKRSIVKKRRPGTRFDIICEGETPVGNAKKGLRIVKDWEEAGATWWIESRWSKPGEALPRVKQGPPLG